MSNSRAKRYGFTLIELLVVVSIIALLITILLHSLGNARRAAQTTRCLANAKGLALAATIYASANDNRIIPSAMNYVGTDLGFFALVVDGDLPKPPVTAASSVNFRSSLICPSTVDFDVTSFTTNQTRDGFWQGTATAFDANLKTGAGGLFLQASYGLNGNVNHDAGGTNGMAQLPCQPITPTGGSRKMSIVGRPASAVFMYDGVTVNPDYSTAYRIMGRHGRISGADAALTGTTNIAFFDGHAENVDRKKLPHDAVEFTNNSPATILTQHGNYIWRLDQNP